MQLRRVLPLVGVLFTTAATASIVAACGGDDKTIYVYVEAGAATDAGSTRDSSTTVVPTGDDDDSGTSTCNPGTPAAFTFKPAVRYQNKCDDTAIAALLNDCVFGTDVATCTTTSAQYADCYACMVGTPQDSVAHPLFIYDTGVGPIASTGVCAAAYANDGTSTSDCSFAFGEIETCAYEACVPQCLDADETDFEACLSASLSSVCTTGGAVFSSTKCQTEFDGTKYGFCLNSDLPDGGTLSNGDYYTMLTQLVCGAPPADAGTTDAGTDAGADAGDGGDGGDGG